MNGRVSTLFLSTPSARRATQLLPKLWLFDGISIHALREEGDEAFMEISLHKTISIHALREEGDAGGDADADT